jgi:hypothetical protein
MRPWIRYGKPTKSVWNSDLVQTVWAMNPRKPHTWGHAGKSQETDAEWIARGGHLTTKNSWDAIDFGVKAKLHDWLGKSASHMPEHDFWEAFFTLTVEDALGISPTANEPCVDCHRESEDGCSFGKGQRKTTQRNIKCTWTPHTVQQCALDYLNGPMAAEDCETLGIAVDYLRRLLKQTNVRPKRAITKQPVEVK